MIGLTGGIGSGKSTVSAMLAQSGAVVIDADEGARAVVEAGQPALDEVVQAFGPEVLNGSGYIDRDRLADLVFGDEDARHRLEKITHPRVMAWMADRVQEAAAAGTPAVVLDVPLLFETGLEAVYDEVWVVWCPPDLQVTRAVARGLREEDVRARMKAQMPIDEKRRRATRVIDNSGPLEETRRQVDELWREVSSPAT